MRGISTTIVAIASAAALALAASNATAVDFSAAEKDRLAAGKTVRKPLAKSGENGFYAGSSYALVDAPIDAVWAAITDWGSYPRIHPKTREVTEIASRGDSRLIKMVLGHELISVEYHMQVELEADAHVLRFDLAKSRPHDIVDSRGYWRLFPQGDGRTLVAYVVAARAPMGVINLLPDRLSAKIERALLGVPGRLKCWVEGPSGARYRTLTASR
jgi:ribosome-associated toxin RatA of RatAB toxin-antitoxin module